MNKIQVKKIGLLNFWLYDEEEYDFYDGKLILRGTNGSGKSVTMQSFIPLILDGNKSPDRLDPFGSKERKIEDYILGDKESVQKEEAISYLYMETFNNEKKTYITVGLGFRGRKGRPVESWGFSLKDGKRIGKDFYLYKDPINKIPLTKNELKSRLGTINELTETAKDYKEMVNRLLFGFPNLDTYDEFIKLLLQLRSNKLSKDYKPTNLINVLNTVLQPLSEDDLKPLSEAVEQMNKTKEQIETLEKNYKALKDFLKVYKNYNEIVLLTKAKNYKNINDEVKEIKKNISNLQKDLEDYKDKLITKKERYNKVIETIEIDNETKKQLDDSDLKQKIESLSSIKENIKTLKIKIENLEEQIDTKEQTKIELNVKYTSLEDEVYKLKKEMDEVLIDLKDLGDKSYFDEIMFFVDELQEDYQNKNIFDSIFMSLKSYREKINRVKILLEEEQKVLYESESKRVDFDKLSNEYKEIEKDISKEEKNLKESIMSWEEDFINNLNNNKYLKLEDSTKKSIFDLINNYTKYNYTAAKDIYINSARDKINEFIKKNLELENKTNEYKRNLQELKLNYDEILSKDDIEIPSLNEETDKILKENNIENVSLYKCIEFKSNVDEKTRNNIESALFDLNILNAKVINEQDIEKVKKLNTQILYLTKTSKKKDNLLKYFDIKLDKNIKIKENYIKEILESISTNPKDIISIDEKGYSKVDILNSVVDSKYKQTFIGYLKRKELKEKKLKELEEQINAITSEINNLNNIIINNQDIISVLEKEMKTFPSDDSINEVIDKINNLTKSLEWNDKKQKELEEVLTEIDNKLKEIKDKISDNVKGLYVPLNINSYKEVELVINSIYETLQNLKNTHMNYLSNIEMKSSIKERIDDTVNNIEYLNEEKSDKEKQLNLNIQNEKTINELLETKEYKNKKEKLINLEEELINLNKEKELLIKENSIIENDIKHKEEDLEKILINKEYKEKELDIYKEIFIREYNLKYVYQESLEDTESTAKKIIKESKREKEISLSEALSNFYTSYNHYSLELNDYSLRNITLFNDYEIDDDNLKKIYESNIRVDVTSMYQGIKLNVIELFNKLESDIEENKYLISKQDRHLFEDILLNTVGEKIRNRINSSKEWVDKINNIMSTMLEKSALRFRLVWKSISAEGENEIDTKELVRILKLDPKLLKDKDRENLTNHFRSKLKKAEELYQDSFISFYKIIEEVLDYRSWFTFQLMYQREGTTWRELTDKTFSKFSGGERAKSMYIPLFASVYAKLNLARKDSLRLIALDEAFAGVDEDNIREMFGILKYLDIDFVINSQVLWGDYDTIEDLSICELIRPQNSSVVTVERYRWNGTYKEIINNRKEYNEELEHA